MDTSAQLYEQEATGWQRGLYDDVTSTFRAPVVNWIWRTLMANEPEFVRYAWGQLRPVFDTRAFGRASVAYRDAVLSAVEADHDLPGYRREGLGVSPAEYEALRGQVATFDVVSARLAVLFETVDRCLSDEPVGHEPARDRAATEPLPAWLDRDRGRQPTMTDLDPVPDALTDVVPAIRAFHGLDEGMPSIYRCLAQWPEALARLWHDVEPVLSDRAFDRGVDAAEAIVDDYVDGLAYRPQLSPDALARAGFDEATVADLRELFATFNTGPIETVVPALPVYAAAFDASGERSFR